jgi:hypothetical protein
MKNIEMTIFMIHKLLTRMRDRPPNALEWLRLFVDFEVPTIRPQIPCPYS